MPADIRTAYLWCQINKPLYILVKQYNFITLVGSLISRFPNLFGNSTDLSFFARRLIFVTLIFIYICWYWYVLDYFNQENLHILTLVYVKMIKKPSVKKITLILSIKWPLNYLLSVFLVCHITTICDKKIFCQIHNLYEKLKLDFQSKTWF